MLTWRTVDAKTGLTVEEFPGASVKGDIVQVIGRGEPVTVEIPWPDRMPDRWQTATEPGRMVLICEDDDRIWWGGLIIERSFGHGPTLTVQADAPEGLLGRTFVPDLTFTQTPQTEIMAELGLYWLADALHGRVEVGVSTVLRDRGEKYYRAEDDKARLDMMTNLMKTEGGPEFTTRWDRLEDGTVELVCITADRLGLAATADEPPTIELYPDEWSYTHSYGDGKGAPIVRASTTKEGTEGGEQVKVTAERRDQLLLDAGWVPLEERFSPETGSVNPDVIGQYADGRLLALSRGTIVITARVLIEDFPLNGDLHLGDDVSLVLGPNELPAQGSPTMAPYAPGINMLVGSLWDLVTVDEGLGMDVSRRPTQIIADARMLGWALAPEAEAFTHATLVLDLKGIRGWN